MKTKYVAVIVLLVIFATSCKKSLVGSHMTVTQTNANLSFGEVNVFSPNGDGRNDRFNGPVYCRTTAQDSVTGYTLKISGNTIRGRWDGSGKSDGIYDYEVDYTTVGGSAKVTGLVRLWRNSKVPCAEKNLYRFPDSYDAYTCSYYTGSASDENLPCK